MPHILLAALGLAAADPAPAPAPAPAAAPMKAQWVSDWGEDRCSLIRHTGGEAGATLMIRTVPGTTNAEFWFLDPNWEGKALRSYSEVEFRLEPTPTVVTSRSFSVTVNGSKGLAVTAMSADFFRDLPQAKKIVIRQKERPIAEVPVPGTAKAVAVLRDCESTVLKDMGLDPQVMASLNRRVTPEKPLASYFGFNDYPDLAIRKGEAGTVLARITIGATGAIEGCTVIETSRSDLLDRTTCSVIMKRVRYKPALAADGTAVRALDAIRIWWSLPQ
jgi:TonB family protein